MTAKSSEDDSFVVSALHRHLKKQLASTTRETEYSRGQRDALVDTLGFLDGVSGGRYPSGMGGAE